MNIKDNFTKACFTGYRPQKFPFPLEKGNSDFEKFENDLFEQILALAEEGCRTFYCGMAMGFDLLSADVVLSVKKAFKEPLRLICVRPFDSQGSGFPEPWNTLYREISSKADEIVTLSDTYYRGCYQVRNIYMVDNSDFVITWYDGQSGGTENTIKYARKIGRQIFNIYKNLSSQLEMDIS